MVIRVTLRNPQVILLMDDDWQKNLVGLLLPLLHSQSQPSLRCADAVASHTSYCLALTTSVGLAKPDCS
jgi:hypothetical protein